MKKSVLTVNLRTLLGRKVKQLRQSGQLPGNIFGRKVKSTAVTVPMVDFNQVYAQAGETGLVELTLAGEKRPVLIQNVQLHPVTELPLHVDFRQVDLKEKIKANIPIEISGMAPAVDQKLGVLLTLIDEIEVEAYPADLPDKIAVDVSLLAQVNDLIKVSDIKLPSGVTVVTLPETEVVKIGELVTKEAEALVVAEEAAKAAAAAETAPAAPTPGVPATEADPEAATMPPPKPEK